ncbi:MAG: amino acid ABC transporter permease [Erysipelotrichaceae bacterium]|nr:amino acid ABC transporter permease [Erysipelotrichaceae bacterium]
MGPGIIEVFIEYWPMFLKGALGTLRYAAIAVAGGSILGTLIAILRFKIFDGIATIYVDVLRGTPLLVQMYIAYFFLPLVFPALNKVDKEVTVLIALTLNSSAYVSEIIRGGINSVDIGQTEAARSLGLSAKNTMIKIILPQAIKNILPSLANEYISMIKETSMAGTFMLYELMYTRTLLANKYLAWQPLFIIAGIYLVMTLVLTNLVKLFERRMSVSD